MRPFDNFTSKFYSCSLEHQYSNGAWRKRYIWGTARSRMMRAHWRTLATPFSAPASCPAMLQRGRWYNSWQRTTSARSQTSCTLWYICSPNSSSISSQGELMTGSCCGACSTPRVIGGKSQSHQATKGHDTESHAGRGAGAIVPKLQLLVGWHA